ncbi:hypothetical protein IID21_01080 [Patescibacteria group bacterium]|nr:hypothetical protein [Patescibacteria group bacterium]
MNKKLIIIFLFAFALRLSLAFIAHHGDLNNNISWGTLAAGRGLSGFYEGEDWPYSAPNQPPLTILMLTGVRVVWQAIENASWWLNNNFKFFYSPFIWFWEAKGMTLLVKLPGILADLGIAWLIFKYFETKNKPKLGFILSSVWLFNPVTWYNSAIWGQTDSVVNFLGFAAILFLLRKKLVLFSIFFSLSLLFKGSLSIFIPILLIVTIWQKYSLKEWVRSAIAVLATIILLSVWFHPEMNLFAWLYNLYKNRFLPGEIGYLTANSFNFWWLVDSGKTLDSTVFLGLPARVWGFITALAGIAGFLYWLRKKITDKRLFLSLALVSLLTFLFMTRIHERYLYPFFPYATMLLGFIPALVFPYILLSMTHLLNLYHLFWAPSFPPLEALYLKPWFAQAISVINIIVFFYLLRSARQRT